MKVKTKFLQEGGQAPAAPEQTGAPQAGGQEQIMGIAQEIIGQFGPEGAAMLAQVIMEMLQGGQQPTYAKRGGKLVRIK